MDYSTQQIQQLGKYKGGKSIWKDAQHHMFSDNCEIKQQLDTITYLIE